MRAFLFSGLCFASLLVSAGIPVVDTSNVCLYESLPYSFGSIRHDESGSYVCCFPSGSLTTPYWDQILSDKFEDALWNCKTFE